MAGGYPELIQPIIPDAQKNRSPDLLIEGFTRGMAAFTQAAQVRRQQESDIARLALQERLATEQHALEQQKMEQAARLIPSQINENNAHTKLFTEQAGAASRVKTTAAELEIQKTKSNELLMNEVGKDVATWNLEDAYVQTRFPVKFGMGADAFAEKYRWSTVPAIRAASKKYLEMADEQTVMMKHSVVDEEGKFTTSGQGVRVPLRKVALAATNPATSAQTLRDLEANGHKDVIRQIQEQFTQGGKSYTDNLSQVAGPTSAEPVDYGVSAPALPPEYQQALDWARANPTDPRAEAIFKKLGVQ